MSSGISVFFIQKLAGPRRIEREDHAAVGRQRLAVHQPHAPAPRRARHFDGEAVRLARSGDDRQRHLLEPGGERLERAAAGLPPVGRPRATRAGPSAASARDQELAQFDRGQALAPSAIRASAAGPAGGRRSATGAPSPCGRRCPRLLRLPGAVEEAVALDAIEPFDLHRLILAGGVGKRLAIRALGGRMAGRAAIGKAVDRSIDNILRACKPRSWWAAMHSIVAPSGSAAAAMFLEHAEMDQDVAVISRRRRSRNRASRRTI